ncbi:hypothetical protein [Desulfosporosinus sp. BG]|uniref:hypothetical protein n=1 Tax=Desulfosporosinus sp. BG TaxID=1633135 RepID=UPI00083B7ACA|nr:hypothetical protein [Desulfosporosinus sp. BG]
MQVQVQEPSPTCIKSPLRQRRKQPQKHPTSSQPRRPNPVVPTPVDPQAWRKFLSLGSALVEFASMSADDKALRNSTVNMQKAQRF